MQKLLTSLTNWTESCHSCKSFSTSEVQYRPVCNAPSQHYCIQVEKNLNLEITAAKQ